ncbi:DUF6053 domain-containing protein [Lysobacter enzymogenes]|uniref:DUF6053 domain-containing protein n=1 Tax=Lysobacter enzymogenes TaxID=69 RepID=UPI003D18A295
MGGASAPMPFCRVAAIRNKSIGAEAPPTRVFFGVGRKRKTPARGPAFFAARRTAALTSSSAPRPAR